MEGDGGGRSGLVWLVRALEPDADIFGISKFFVGCGGRLPSNRWGPEASAERLWMATLSLTDRSQGTGAKKRPGLRASPLSCRRGAGAVPLV